MPVIFTTDVSDDVIEVEGLEPEEGPRSCLVQFRGIMTIQGLIEAAESGRHWYRAERVRRQRDPDNIRVRIHPSRREELVRYARPGGSNMTLLRPSQMTAEQRRRVADDFMRDFQGHSFRDVLRETDLPKVEERGKRRILLQEEEKDG